MNATVSRIVDLLFEDVVMTEETEAIRDEVMNNCQERYTALIADGYTEDDAIGAVVESLKGMDEVLKDYPRTANVDDTDAFRKEDDAYSWIRWDSIDALRIQVQSADVEVQPSEDGKTSMELHNGTRTMLCPQVEGNTLVITQEKKNEEPEGKQLSIEETLEQIEARINILKKEDTTLEEAFAAYREGMELARACDLSIGRIEKRVQEIAEDGSLQDFETEGEEDA